MRDDKEALKPGDEKMLEDDELDGVAGGANTPLLSNISPSTTPGTNPTGLTRYD